MIAGGTRSGKRVEGASRSPSKEPARRDNFAHHMSMQATYQGAPLPTGPAETLPYRNPQPYQYAAPTSAYPRPSEFDFRTDTRSERVEGRVVGGGDGAYRQPFSQPYGYQDKYVNGNGISNGNGIQQQQPAQGAPVFNPKQPLRRNVRRPSFGHNHRVC